MAASVLSTTRQGGRFSLLLQLTKIIMAAATDLFTTHQLELGLLFTLLVGANLMAALALPIYSTRGTQSAYEALLVLDVWTCAVSVVVAAVDDRSETAPAWLWWAGVLVLPAVWYKSRMGGLVQRSGREKVAVAPMP
jgi:hypothetical protein